LEVQLEPVYTSDGTKTLALEGGIVCQYVGPKNEPPDQAHIAIMNEFVCAHQLTFLNTATADRCKILQRPDGPHNLYRLKNGFEYKGDLNLFKIDSLVLPQHAKIEGVLTVNKHQYPSIDDIPLGIEAREFVLVESLACAFRRLWLFDQNRCLSRVEFQSLSLQWLRHREDGPVIEVYKDGVLCPEKCEWYLYGTKISNPSEYEYTKDAYQAWITKMAESGLLPAPDSGESRLDSQNMGAQPPKGPTLRP
jgi:hypothetical protein